MIISSYFEDQTRFQGAGHAYEASDVALFGIPYDGTASSRPGSREGPGAIRRASWDLEDYSPVLQRSLLDCAICDLHDLSVYGTQQELFRNAAHVARRAVEDEVPFIVLGGEHSITVPLVEGVQEATGELAMLVFDAHLDLRQEYLGNPLSHACVVRRCMEITPHIYHFGGRSGSREEWSVRTQIQAYDELLPESVVSSLQSTGMPLYISIDIDVLDPAFAPGVSTPEPGGFSTSEVQQALHRLQPLHEQIVGCDVVEVTPQADPAGITAAAAAKVVRELLLMIGR